MWPSNRYLVYTLSAEIPGMTLIAERPHKKHGTTIFVREELKVKIVSIRDEGNDELPVVVVHSVYKPPTKRFVLFALGQKPTSHCNWGFQ